MLFDAALITVPNAIGLGMHYKEHTSTQNTVKMNRTRPIYSTDVSRIKNQIKNTRF